MNPNTSLRYTVPGKTIAFWRWVVPALLVLVQLPALAQPVVGSTYKEYLPLGGGSSVALPEGTWLSTQNSTNSRTGYNWESYTLTNQQPDARVPYLVVRQAVAGVRWGNTNCQSNSQHQFLVNLHGTKPSELMNKCSRFFAIGSFDLWKEVNTWTNPNDKEWWINVVPGFDPAAKPRSPSLLMAELTVQQFNGKGLRIEAFVLPPKGISAIKFRDAVKAGEPRPEQPMLETWASIYIESIQQSFFNKQPQPIMALAYPVNGGAQGTPSTAVAILGATDTAADEAFDKAHAQRTMELLREMETTAAAAVKPSAPIATAAASVAAPVASLPSNAPAVAKPQSPAAAPKPIPPAQTVMATTADVNMQQRLEQERKALEEEKRKMAQQMEAMTQMLAKLQKENAAAAKAKEDALLAQTEAVSKAPVTYANRKALVIGNDLYTDVPKLNNAGADAEAMAKSLEAVGYKVFKHLNLSEKRFKQAIRDFRQNLSGGDEVLFFFAGHGVQLGNANYLLPTDVKGDQEDQVKDDAILLQKVLDDLEEKKTKFALAVIDACRDNPFKGKGRAIGGRGLAPTSAATGQMIMFSAGSGQQALDRLGDNDKDKNGLFTRIFVKEMLKPGLSVDRVLRNVRNEVVRLARSVGHEQTPALYDQAIGEFYFKQ
jgi:Skp family chaperone for outer membrane proteins